MKICPKCQKTYGDENLNFCLDDGTTLMQSSSRPDSLPATVMINQARPTNEPAQFGNQSGAGQTNWNTPNRYSMQPPPPKSKTWLWVVGILGGLMLICGGGFVGFVYWAASLENANSNTSRNRLANTNFNSYSNSNSVSVNVNRTQPAPSVKNTVQKIDLSRWADGDTELGNTEFVDNELLMGSKQKGYYYVLAAKPDYKTENATTKVTVKNVSNEKSALGFGLIIHSNPVPLRQDYAFLIDSVNKKYRIVRHLPGDEIPVVNWTRSSVIKDGTDENTLEIRDENKTMSFYINGESVKSLPNTDGYSGGVTGLYSGDGIQIAFSNLEISK